MRKALNIFGMCALLLVGCSKEVNSITYDVATGDTVKVHATSNYSLAPVDTTFVLTDTEDVEVLSGVFLSVEQYNEFVDNVEHSGEEGYTPLDIVEYTDDEIIYSISYEREVEHEEEIGTVVDIQEITETTFVKLLSDSTAVTCHSTIERDVAMDCWESLVFTVN